MATTYGHDGISRLTSLTHTMSGGNIQNQTYGLAYTASSQLKSVSQSNIAYVFPQVSSVQTYTVNGQNELTTASTVPVAYDARGNLTSDSVTTFTYDLLNRLQGTSTSAGPAASAIYDPEDRLVSLSLNGTTTQFGYLGPDVATEYNVATGQIYRRYVPGPAEDETEVWLEGADASKPRWLLEDHHGSVVAVTDMTGGALAINTYDDYGMPGAANLGRFQYTGQMWLSEVGLYDYKARLYSPTLGRFMQTDPVGYEDGMNWYDYAHDDPVNEADPAGTCAITDSDSPCPPTDGAIAAYEAKVSSAQVGDGSYSSSGLTNGFSSSNSKASNASNAQQNSGTQFAQVFPLPPIFSEVPEEVFPPGEFLEPFEEGVPQIPRPSVPFPRDPTLKPGPEWEWRGPPDKGQWFNPRTGESMRWDPHEADPRIPPHYDYSPGRGQGGRGGYRWFPNGTIEPKGVTLPKVFV